MYAARRLAPNSVHYPIVYLWENLPPNLDRTTQPN